jgi:DNA-binding protein Fis
LEKNTASPAVINSMMSDIVEVFKTIDKCTRLRDRVSESLKDYLRGVEGVDISSEEEGANLDDDE